MCQCLFKDLPAGVEMGNLAGGPNTEKDSSDGVASEQGLYFGVSSMQGWRDNMEDTHLTVKSLGSSCAAYLTHAEASGWTDTSVFGVMDGHGGAHVARFCERYLPQEIARGSSEDVDSAMLNAFYRMDSMLADPHNLEELRSMSGTMKGLSQGGLKSWFASPNVIGCTAVVCCVRQDEIIIANAGDSRAVLCNRGTAIDLSEDHKPNLPNERDRINRAGGTIAVQRIGHITQYRVNGGLNLSRSIGDLAYKQNSALPAKDQMVCCTPEIKRIKRKDTDEFMIICCDGVWDVLQSQEVVDWIRERLGNMADLPQRVESGSLRLSTILEDLLDHCLSPDLQSTHGLGGDNMTAVLVIFGSKSAKVSRSKKPGSPQGDRGRMLEHTEQVMPNSSWLCGADC